MNAYCTGLENHFSGHPLDGWMDGGEDGECGNEARKGAGLDAAEAEWKDDREEGKRKKEKGKNDFFFQKNSPILFLRLDVLDGE